MESQEAIMENENNSNLESESIIRDRERKETTGELLDNVTSSVAEPQHLSPKVTLQENESNMPTEDSNIAITTSSGPSNANMNELVAEGYVEHNDNFESRKELASATVLTSHVEEDIQDYEDFIGINESSQGQEKFQSAHSDDTVEEEVQRCKESSNVGPQEEQMEVDDISLEHVSVLADSDVHSQHLDNQDSELGVYEDTLHASKISEVTDVCEKDQLGFLGDINGPPESASFWDDEMDLLGEDSKNSSSHENLAPEEGKLKVHRTVLNAQENAVEDSSGEWKASLKVQKIVNVSMPEKSLELPSEVEMIEQDTPERVISSLLPETASFASFLPDEVNSPDETAHVSLAQSLLSLNNSCSQNGEKVVENLGTVMLNVEVVAPVEECINVADVTDKPFSDTNVAGSTEVADCCMMENTINDNQSDEILSLGDSMPQAEKIADEDIEASENVFNPAVDNSRIHADEMEKGYVSEGSDSECHLSEANVTLQDAVSEVTEPASVTERVISNVIDLGIVSQDSVSKDFEFSFVPLEDALSKVTESGIVTDEAKKEHVSRKIDSECDLDEANNTLEDMLSKFAESDIVTEDAASKVIESGILTTVETVPKVTDLAIVTDDALSTDTVPSIVTEHSVYEATESDIVTEESVSEATESGVVTEESVSQATESGVVTEESVSQATESGVVTEELVSEATESDIVTEESVSGATESGVVTEESVSEATESDIVTEESVSGATESGVVTEESVSEATESGVVTEESVSEATESGVVTSEDVISTVTESNSVMAEDRVSQVAESGIDSENETTTVAGSGIVISEDSVSKFIEKSIVIGVSVSETTELGIVTEESVSEATCIVTEESVSEATESGIVIQESISETAELGIITEESVSDATESGIVTLEDAISKDFESDNVTNDIVSIGSTVSSKCVTSCEGSKHLTLAQDKNSEGVREDITDAVDDIANVFGNHTSSEHPKELHTHVNASREEEEMEVTKETVSDNSLESRLTSSSEHQKVMALNVGVEKDISAGEECTEASSLHSYDKAMDVEICHDIDQTCDKNDAQLNKKILESIETANDKSISPKTNKTNKSPDEPTVLVDNLAVMETNAESIEKDSEGQDKNSNRDASIVSPPSKDTKSRKAALEISQIKTETSSSNKITKGKLAVTTRSVKQDFDIISKTKDSAENKIAVDDKTKVTPVKNETFETNVAENGVDGKDLAVLGQQQQEKNPGAAVTGPIKRESKRKSSKSKEQTCLVCQKICKCKYNIVRNGEVKHLCDDACFKQFRKTPSVFLTTTENSKPSKTSATKKAKSASSVKDALALYQKEIASQQSNSYKTCTVCQLLNLNACEPYCNWKGLDFCGESCLGKFQANLNTSCSFCHAYIPIDMRTTCCVKIGNDMRPFCKQRCYNEFKKKLRMCAFCQRDLAGVSAAFTAMVGTEGKFKEFCSQSCMKSLENEMTDLKISVEKGNLKHENITCFICKKHGPLKYTVQLQGKGSKLCSDLCLSALKFANKISLDTCDNCGTTCTAEEAQAHFMQHEGQLKHFCSDNCVSIFRKANSKVVQCGWCVTKKLNVDMIEKQDSENKIQMFCSLNCLSLYRVNQQAKSGQAVPCDQCLKVESAQYHLTMSDASVRNFCSYTCVVNFQSHFAKKRTSPASVPASSAIPSPQPKPQQPGHLPQQQQQVPLSRSGRMNTRQATARQHSPTVPVISNVVSLAVKGGDQKSQIQPSLPPPSQVPTQTPPPPLATPSKTTTATGNVVPSADGKHQILIQAAPLKVGKNKSLQCRPVTQTKATSCRPQLQTRETQTDEAPPKCILVPIPVPIYIPMPTVMFTAPTPKLVPFPIPIPVPIFIPTTRKSVHGISKAIQEIVERMPADPLEAELLMMAEAVAADRRPGDSDTDSETDNCAEDFSVPVEDVVIRPAPREDESLMMRKREGQGEEDMIQMALRMAEEMSGPIEDLETSVEPVAVSTEAPPPNQQNNIQAYENQLEEEYNPSRTNQHRVMKRANRVRPPPSRVKRQRMEEDSMQSEPSVQLQSMEPPPDTNYRLKFTYGVNAWRHWVLSKNAQIEKMKQATGSSRLRPFSTDILKCTTDELNHTLCMFIREVRKPNGGEYSPDSIYYLCLGIQQYLYENNRIENIFTDSYFEKFTDCLNDILKTLQPKVNSQGQMLCRIEEEHLWESKQLGAHSPFILLNTLIYFHTKHFILKNAQEHMALSFAQILKHWKKGMPLKGQSAASGKNVALRFYCLANGKKDGLAARKNKDGVPVYEVTENFDNPLRCPVKLYEFFLSKCPESIKNRNDIFYPVPERSCVPDSPVWYSTQSIDIHTMDKMLTRVLLVREIQEAHLHAQPVYL